MANLSSRSSPSLAALERPQQQPADSLSSDSSRAQSLRVGSASPSAFDPRYISKRTRELQVQDMSFWPQLGANSPLVPPTREPESVFDNPPSTSGSISSVDLAGVIGLGSDLVGSTPSSSSSPSTFSPAFRQRARAGTLPSRLSSSSFTGGQILNPIGNGVHSQSILSSTAPSPSLFSTHQDQLDRHMSPSIPLPSSSSVPHQSSVQSRVQSRYRSGSLNLPAHRPMYGAFGSSVFSSNSWNGASESMTSEHEQPALSTLDYLGLEDTTHPVSRHPQENAETAMHRLTVPNGPSPSSASANSSFLADMSRLRTDVNRLRSYSVNGTERYDERNGVPLEGLVEEMDEHHDLDQLGQLGGHHNVSSRPRSRTTAGPDLQSRIKTFVQVQSRRDYTPNISNSAGILNGDIVTAEESSIINSLDDKSVGPTRALWLGSIPPTATVASLTSLFSQYGTVESARILSDKSSGFINYSNTDAAIQAKAALNGTEIAPGTGPLRIGFAKVVQPSAMSISTLPQSGPNNTSSDISYTVKDTTKLEKVISIPTRTLCDMELDMVEIVRQYGADDDELSKIRSNLSNAISFTSFIEELPALPDPNPNRVYDAPKLRDIRKRIDNGSCSVSEIEAAAVDMLDEIAELASDYLGNTVVQKLFDNCSEEVKTKMLRRLAPYLAQLGIHKNGTWAAQKVIDVANTTGQMEIIANNLRPYTVHLFLDQFGNYVLQCCLRFGSPYNDFIFETMLSRFWDIAQGRFGARAMRACLESHYVNKEQQRVLAAAITLHAVQLATNANGALLLTWFLDTCTLPNRHRILAPRLIPHLVALCTHKLASLTVLKVVNYRAEPEARRAIFDSLILNPDESALEEILRDSAQGPIVIYKILTTPFLETDIRQRSIAAVRNVLFRLKVHPSQGYRRLMDEVGLSTRSNGSATASGGMDGAQQNSTGQSNRSSNHQNHHYSHNHHHNGRAYSDGHQREFGEHAQPTGHTQQLSYYGSSIYDPASLDYISARPGPAAMDYLTMQMEQMGLGAAGPPEQQYAAASSQMVNPSVYQQSLLQQQLRTGQSQSPYFYVPNSPPPPAGYADQYRGLSSRRQTQAVSYTAEEFRGLPLVGGPGVNTQQLHAPSPVLNGSHLMYSTYLGGMTPIYNDSPHQQAQNVRQRFK
ncbi:hypothetical protein V1508DRAFT_399838 [Lipomyces doorenjongii]|uniref:uncharacterized protein n=1 Tax=Lipomyces doorenjongii TaxID=383834 RepID=UPI0034CD3C9F